MRDQILTAAAGNHLDLSASAAERFRERGRKFQFRRRHHASIDLDDRIAAEFIESQGAIRAGLQPDSRTITEFGGRRFDQVAGIEFQLERMPELRRDQFAHPPHRGRNGHGGSRRSGPPRKMRAIRPIA